VAKFDAAGNHLWSKRYGDAALQYGLAIAVDPSNNIIMSGINQGTADFGGDAAFGAGVSTSAGDTDVVLAKLSPSGNTIWVQTFGGAGQDVGKSVAVGSDGRIVTGGYFAGTVDFGGGPLTAATGAQAGFITTRAP
jgi:hypothetical protein